MPRRMGVVRRRAVSAWPTKGAGKIAVRAPPTNATYPPRRMGAVGLQARPAWPTKGTGVSTQQTTSPQPHTP